jgi:type IV secretory pathway VirJ component
VRARSLLATLLAATVGCGGEPAAARGATRGDAAHLPLIEVPAVGTDSARTLAVLISGDGGWARIDREIAGTFAARGIPTVGVNARRYYWNGGSPDSTAHDVARLLRHYLPAWRRDRVLLVGYSRGADVMPFVAARLPDDLKRRVSVVALIAPARTASFHFHLADLVGAGARPGEALPTAGEIARIHEAPVLCFYGTEDSESVCPTLAPAVATAIARHGGHHLDGDYRWIAERVLAAPP